MTLSVTKTIVKSRSPIFSSTVSLFKNVTIFRIEIGCLRCRLRTSMDNASVLESRLHLIGKSQGLLLGGALDRVSFVRPHDSLYKRMTDHISFIEMYERNALDAGYDFLRFH